MVGPHHWLVDGWQQALRKVLEVPGASLPEYRAASADVSAWPGWTAPTWCRLECEELPGAYLAAGCPSPTVQVLGRLFARDTALPEDRCPAAFLELVGQTAAGAADAISSWLGRRVFFAVAKPTALPYELDYAVQIELAIGGDTHVMGLVPSPGLIHAPERAGGAEGAIGRAAASQMASPASAEVAVTSRNLDMLLEVELPVSVTFGRTQLALKDVLKLSSGSIVELNRLANEPVEVLINNCVVARGEVVVVEGNYGVRVTEIISRQERIRSIL